MTSLHQADVRFRHLWQTCASGEACEEADRELGTVMHECMNSKKVGLCTVRLTGTAAQWLVRDGYGFTVHRPSKRVSKGLIERRRTGMETAVLRGRQVVRYEISISKPEWDEYVIILTLTMYSTARQLNC